MKCPDAVKLSQLLNDELEGEEFRDVEAHVEGCPACQATLHRLLAGSGEAELTPGAADRFRPLRFHARGGLGEVFVAEDVELHREVALKRMQARCEADPESRRRFLLEAEVTGRLEHPGVVPVYGLGQDADGRPCYAMRFIRGETLDEAIRRFHDLDRPGRRPSERSLAVRELLGRFVAVCKTVAYAHSRGILHRDLKPGNVMLGRYSETLVVDWGLAKAVDRDETARAAGEETLTPVSLSDDSGTQVGVALGTPEYMSAEQASGEWGCVGRASDVYSLGAILYKLLTGQTPFAGGDVQAKLAKVKRGEFPRPRQVKKACPPALEAVCLKAMALRPEERYGTAEALAADVERWLADEPVAAWREPWAVRARRWARQHRTLATAAATAMLLAVLVGTGVCVYAERQAAELHQAVEAGLKQVVDLREQSRWELARVALNKTRERLGTGGPADLQQRLERESANLDLVDRLDAIRLKAATSVDGKFDYASADRDYARAFPEAAFATEEEPALVAARVRDSAVKEQLLAALDDWARVTRDKGRRAWLLAVARKVDPDEQRDRLRDPALWEHPTELKRQVDKADVKNLTPTLAVALGARLWGPKGDGIPLLTKMQFMYPKDFWLALMLGHVLDGAEKLDEAAGFYRVAIALRPETPAAWTNLGDLLKKQGRVDEAIVHYHRAIASAPDFVVAHLNLGIAYSENGQGDKAIEEHQKAIAIDPKLANAHLALGMALFLRAGRFAEACEALRQGLDLLPETDPLRSGTTQQLGLCERLLAAEQKLPAILNGDALPADSRERFLLAHLCQQYKKRYCAAARFYAEILEPGLATLIVLAVGQVGGLPNLWQIGWTAETMLEAASPSVFNTATYLRYKAGCCAALAGCGKGEDAAGLKDTERARLRQQARNWLTAALALWTNKADGDAKVRAQVRKTLQTWQTDPDLAGIRDPQALATLPEAKERDACRKLWAEVAAVRQKAAGPP